MANNVDLNISVGVRDNATQTVKSMESSIIRFVGAVSAALATVKLTLLPVSEAIAFEAEMKNVAKTTNFTAKELDNLADSYLEMSRKIGKSARELANIGAIAGQMGLDKQGREAVETFTKSVAIAATTLDLTADKAGEAGSQISSIFNFPIEGVERVFATINALSNNSVATGADLIDIIKRVGRASGAAFTDVAALAATMRDLGVPNEQAGTSLVKFLSRMLSDVDKFAKVMQVPVETFVEQVESNTVLAFKNVLSQVAGLSAGIKEETIKKLFGSGRLFSNASKLVEDAANGFKIMNSHLQLSNSEFIKGTSSIQEYEKLMEGVGKQIDVLKNSFTALAIEVGNEVLPVLKQNIEALSETLGDPAVIDYFTELGKSMASFVGGMGRFLSGLAEHRDLVDEVIAVLKIFLAIKIPAILFKWITGIDLLNKSVGFMAFLFADASKQLRLFIAIMSGTATVTSVFGAAAANTTGVLSSLVATVGRAFAAISAFSPILGKFLTAVAVFLSSPAGIAAALVGLTALFWDEIKSLLGIVSKEEQIQREKAAEAKRKAQKEIDDAVSAYEDGISRIKKASKLPIDAFAVTAKGAEEAGKAFISTTNDIVAAQRALENYPTAVNKVAKDLNKYQLFAETTSKEIAKLTESIKTQEDELQRIVRAGQGQGFAPLLTDTGSLEITRNSLENIAKVKLDNLEEARRTLERLRSDQAAWSQAVAASKQRMAELRTEAEQATTFLENVASVNAGNFFTKDLATAVQALSEYRKVTDQITQVAKEVDRLQAKRKDALDNESIVFTEEDIRSLGKYEAELSVLESTGKKVGKAFEEAKDNLSTSEIEKLQSIAASTTSKITDLAGGLKLVEKNLLSFEQLAEVNKKAAVRAAVTNLALKNTVKHMQDGAKAAAAYKKKADGMFDNTGKELEALNKKLKRFNEEFNNLQGTAESDVELDFNIGKVEQDLEKNKKSISGFFDFWISRSHGANKEYLQNLKEQRLAEAETKAEAKKATLEGQSLKDRFNNTLKDTKRLMKEAQKAAKAGDIDLADTLKKQAKGGLDEAFAILKQMQQLRTVITTGSDKGLPKLEFDEAELKSLLRKITKTGEGLGKGISSVNKTLQSKGEELAKRWGDAAGRFESVFAQSESVLTLLRDSFTGADKFLLEADKVLQGHVKEFDRVAGRMEKLQSNPNTAVQSIDPNALASQYLGVVLGVGDQISKASGDALLKGLEDLKKRVATEEIKAKATVDTRPIDERLRATLETERQTAISAEVTEIKVQDGIFPEVQGGIDGVFDQNQVQQEVNKLDLKATIKANVSASGGVTGYATGGPVQGPGTSTSDSILARLSRGEYVIDAFTTRFFGSSFFAGLQSFAKSGRKKGPAMKNGLPAYAGGGPVDIPSFPLPKNLPSDIIERVEVTINDALSGTSNDIPTTRTGARELVDALKKIRR